MDNKRRKTSYYSSDQDYYKQYSRSVRDDKRRRRLTKLLTVILIFEAVLIAAVIYISLGRNRRNEAVAPAETETETEADEQEDAVTEYLPKNELADGYWGKLVYPETTVPCEHVAVHGIYVGAGLSLEDNLELIQNSELDTIVIDLKEVKDDGIIYFDSKNELAATIGGAYVTGQVDVKSICETCHELGIRVIGRMVCFKDSKMAEAYPERAIRDADGNVLHFTNEGDMAFLDPYNSDNWDYLIDLAIEAIDLGLDEIQFDYARFPASSTSEGADPYYETEENLPTKTDAINRFLQTARIRIQDTYGVPVAADIFGSPLISPNDGNSIGQDWETVGLTAIDSVCPMVYPSHYALGTTIWGMVFESPDKEPYQVLYNIFNVAPEYLQEGYSTVRCYLQAFTASYIGAGNYITYDYAVINSQICALQDVGLDEFILWNASGIYPEGQYSGNAEYSESERPGETARSNETEEDET